LTPQTGNRVEDRFRPPREANLLSDQQESKWDASDECSTGNSRAD
jgi:hypothetical protein